MGKLTLEIHHNTLGWLEAAELNFISRDLVELAYDLDYVAEYSERMDRYALSIQYPVEPTPYRGKVPGFILDLIPQGEPLKKLRARYKIDHDDQYEEILTRAPLASPGNIRIKEAWQDIEAQRPAYSQKGFTKDDIVQYQTEFTDYMERVGAPIGGTSGAGGGSPKFLLREDIHGRFHAEGMLDDSKTKNAYLIKFPYTDSTNSVMLSLVEKSYYDFIRELPMNFGEPIELHGNVLFIKRFDRTRDSSGALCYHGLESLYSAHNNTLHGSLLYHEDNLDIIARYSSSPAEDIVEYLKRDLLNQILANTDNHGRNTSLIKKDGEIRLSPIYDVTAMKFFRSEPITRLTKWSQDHLTLKSQVQWIEQKHSIPWEKIKSDLTKFLVALGDIEKKLKKFGVPNEIIEPSANERNLCLQEIKTLIHS